MWSNDEDIALISSIECQVSKTYPITSTNNNHDFTGNLLDIIDNWNQIAEKLKRSGELNTRNEIQKEAIESCFCWFRFRQNWIFLSFFSLVIIEWHLIVCLAFFCLFLLSLFLSLS